MTYSEGLASLALRARFTRGLLLGYMATSVVGLAASLAVSFGAARTIPPYFFVLAVGIYVLFLLAVVIIGVIAASAWIWRAWRNLAILGLDGLNFSPAWATASLFVPIVGLYVPFQAMRELYNRSIGEHAEHARASAGDVTSWWACFLGGTGIALFTEGAQYINRTSGGTILIVAHPAVWLLTSLFGAALQLGAAWFLWKVIGTITIAQSSSAGISETFA